MTTIIAPPPLTRFSPADPNPASLAFVRSNPAVGMPTTLEDRTVPQAKLEDDQPRGRPRSRSQGKDSNSDGMLDDAAGDGDANGDNSSNSDGGPARKRRRSRKGLDKKFECPHIGCGKSYSRAEHLHRHQLNHTPKQIYVCDYPGCERHFVRLDLCNRHRDRHTAKGSALNRKDPMPNQSSPTQDARPIFSPAGSVSPDIKRPGTGYGKMTGTATSGHVPYSPKPSSMMPYSPVSGTPANVYANGSLSANGLDYASRDPSAALFDQSAARQRQQVQFQPTSAPQRPSVQTNVDPYGIMSPVSVQQGFQNQNITSTPQSAVFVTPQTFPAFTLPPSDFATTSVTSVPLESNPTTVPNTMPYATAASSDFDTDTQVGGEMMALDQLSLQNTMPMFGTESILQKSPYVGGMPEDFVTFLFNNNTPQDGSPMGSVAYANPYTSLPYYSTEASQLGYFPAAPQQVMSVTNLLDQNPPESIISEEKSQELFDMIKERFHDNGNSPIERHKDLIMDGDRTEDSHLLSRKMMQVYIVSYWLHFSDQVPILHKPTFSPDRTPNLLLIAIMTIGAACLDKAHGQKIIKAGAELSNFLAWNLRWILFMDNLRPPAKLWVFQTLLLLELYEKMYSSRELHERAHIHHATTITLMRRGRALMGKTTVESPPNHRAGSSDNGRSSRHSSTSGPAHTADHWWDNWIENEATRRTAFAAFVIDSIHATMFGHSTVMVAHEMRLPLPCDERLWKATNGAEVGRLEAQLASEGVKHISFLEGLKKTLNGLEVKTNPFGRTILMSGLLSISWHMNQRDLQVNSLGSNASQALGGRDKWRGALTRAFDSWKGDFDKSLKRGDASSAVDPYAYDSANSQEVNVVFESRVVLHHLAHMAMQVDVVDLQICARAKRLLGRAIGSQDIKGAQRRMKDLWAPSARARDATYYALQFLCSVLLRNEGNSPLTNGNGNTSQPDEEPTYAARDDVLLNRPWVLYFAALVVWCYGYALEGPSPESPLPTTRREQVLKMKEYLHRCGSIASPEDLKTIKGINQNSSLLQVLKDAFSTTRWELLHEGSTLLGNCIQLNEEPKV